MEVFRIFIAICVGAIAFLVVLFFASFGVNQSTSYESLIIVFSIAILTGIGASVVAYIKQD